MTRKRKIKIATMTGLFMLLVVAMLITVRVGRDRQIETTDLQEYSVGYQVYFDGIGIEPLILPPSLYMYFGDTRIPWASNNAENFIPAGTAVRLEARAFMSSISGIGVEFQNIFGDNAISFTQHVERTVILSQPGRYFVFAIDALGRRSTPRLITINGVSPTVALIRATSGRQLSNGSYVNYRDVFFVSHDQWFNTYNYISTNGSPFRRVGQNVFLGEGRHIIFTRNSVGLRSVDFRITVDLTPPRGVLREAGVIVASGSYISRSFSFTADGGISGIQRLEIRRPNSNWSNYVAGTIISSTDLGGWYEFRAFDRSGNVSNIYRVYLINSQMSVTLYADGIAVQSGTFTNASHISMSAHGYVRSTYMRPNWSTNFVPYSQHMTFSVEGRYEFFAVDFAGNISDIYYIIIDRTPKPIDIIRDGNSVKLFWEDFGADFAPIVSVTINGRTYRKGTYFNVIDGGVYVIETIDAAGNVWSTEYKASNVEVLSQTINREFWETANSDGNVFAFSSRDNALNFAIAREWATVRTEEWNSPVWDTGIPIDSLNEIHMQNGEFFIYRMTAFFTIERLAQVIDEFANDSIAKHYWWQRNPSETYLDNNLYSLREQRIFVGTSVTLSSHANFLINGESFIGTEFSEEGRHIFTVYDDFGNYYEYVIIILKYAPDILFRVDGGIFNVALLDRNYNFNNAVTFIVDCSLSNFHAMLIIRDSWDQVIAIIGSGEEYTISRSGRFTVQSINMGVISEEITFILNITPSIETEPEPDPNPYEPYIPSDPYIPYVPNTEGSLNAAGVIIIFLLVAGVVVGIGAVIFMRKRKKFKSKSINNNLENDDNDI